MEGQWVRSMVPGVKPLDYSGISSFGASSNASIFMVVPSDAPSNSSFTARTYGFASKFVLERADYQPTGERNEYGDDKHVCRAIDSQLSLTTPLAILPCAGQIVYRSTSPAGRFLARAVDFKDSFNRNASQAVDAPITWSGSPSIMRYHNIASVEVAVYEFEYLKIGDTYLPKSIQKADGTTSKELAAMESTPVWLFCIASTLYGFAALGTSMWMAKQRPGSPLMVS